MIEIGFDFIAIPTALAAFGFPAILASSPYVTVSPTFTQSLRICHTLRQNGLFSWSCVLRAGSLTLSRKGELEK